MRDYADDAPELARRDVAIVRPEEPIPVRAWVKQRQTGEAHVDGEAIAWAGLPGSRRPSAVRPCHVREPCR